MRTRLLAIVVLTLLVAACGSAPPPNTLPPPPPDLAQAPANSPTLTTDQAYVTQAVQAGARGYLLKESAGAELIQAIAAVGAGKTFFSPSVAQVVFDDYVRGLTDRGITDRYDALSEREREVLQLVAEGRSSKEIAELLSISPATVETHRTHVLQKLGLRNTAEVVRFAARRGIVR